jgi:hypothetical protein
MYLPSATLPSRPILLLVLRLYLFRYTFFTFLGRIGLSDLAGVYHSLYFSFSLPTLQSDHGLGVSDQVHSLEALPSPTLPLATRIEKPVSFFGMHISYIREPLVSQPLLTAPPLSFCTSAIVLGGAHSRYIYLFVTPTYCDLIGPTHSFGSLLRSFPRIGAAAPDPSSWPS